MFDNGNYMWTTVYKKYLLKTGKVSEKRKQEKSNQPWGKDLFLEHRQDLSAEYPLPGVIEREA